MSDEIKLKLHDLRKEKKASQNDIAKILGVTRQAYSRYELGDHELGYNALTKLAKYFDVSIDYLLGNSTYFYPDSVKQSTAPALSPDEQEILTLYQSLRPSSKEDLKIYLRALSESSATTTTKKKA